ncbi:hypothetical protein [Schlesneria sp. DSM 10557]|uniref:hypothetical protein n=1 Tax=Schlesneria sp. DSM 10557 TaxID=3044399 RepID=UPI00359F2E46
MRNAASSFGDCPSSNLLLSAGAVLGQLSLVAIVSLLWLNEGIAQDKSEKKPESSATAPNSVELGDSLKKLNLSEKQQSQVKEVAEKYDAAINAVWKQFSDKYMQTIAAEIALMAAVEDRLTEEQRSRIQQMRRKMAQHEKLATAASDDAKAPRSKPIEGVNDELNESGVSLTEEQEELADRVQEKYRPRLRALNREIQGLHARLLSLEADKLVSIEKVLTKEQLDQLREIRQKGPVAAKRAQPKTEAK